MFIKKKQMTYLKKKTFSLMFSMYQIEIKQMYRKLILIFIHVKYVKRNFKKIPNLIRSN